jgi:hypothetical protein
VATAEPVEERGSTKGNTASKTRPGHRAGQDARSALDRVRQVAVRDKEARFTALLHHVDVDRLRDAYRAINPNAAPGVDEVTWAAYGQDLEDNLRGLHQRLHAGRYRARPTRRVYIPKADGRLRPLGIAALEDKILQRAVVEVLNAIYEADFRGFSYGFRPGRGPHDALDALTVGLERKKVNWVLDADIRDFFGQLDRVWLRRFLEHRIADPRVLRLVDKWLAAGVVEDGIWSQTERGSAQGASVSRRCSPTCTCTTSSTCGSIGGDTTRRAATSLSCASLTTSPSGFNIVTTPTGSLPRFATGSPSSVWSFTRTRRG